MSNEKIEKWESEIERIKENQKKMIASNSAKIKSLENRIAEERERMQRVHEKTVLEIVADYYGELTDDNIARFAAMMKKHGHTTAGMEQSGALKDDADA